MASTYSYLYGINTTGLRYFTVYGPWGRPDMAYYKFCDKISKELPIHVFNNGEIHRDFTYIDDIVDGTIAAIDNSYKCEVFNLGNNRCEKVLDMIHFIEKYLGKSAIVEFRGMQLGDVEKTYADIEYSRKKLGYEPKTPLKEGIPKFIKWYKSYNS